MIKFALGAVVLALAPTGEASALQSPSASEEVHYCTIDGPFHLEIREPRLRARYRISRRSIDGIIDGVLIGNMVTARWRDSWGTGPIYIFFSQDRSKFVTAYHEERRPKHWYGPWNGVRADTLADVPDKERYICG